MLRPADGLLTLEPQLYAPHWERLSYVRSLSANVASLRAGTAAATKIISVREMAQYVSLPRMNETYNSPNPNGLALDPHLRPAVYGVPQRTCTPCLGKDTIAPAPAQGFV
ncbi:hypothetical protein DPSP01_012423 [Paraphaeosphaeria sporulosa]